MEEVDQVLAQLRHVSAGRSVAGEPGFARWLEGAARRRDAVAAAQSAMIGIVVAAMMVIVDPFPAVMPNGDGLLLATPGGAVL